MPTNPTPRLGLVAPLGGESLQEGDDRLRTMVDRLEAVVPAFSIGGGSQLPAPGTAGRFFFASDFGILYFDQGGRWRVVGGHTGQMAWTTRTTAPFGYLICAGQPITAVFPELRQRLIEDGNPYGVDGSGNPRLPNVAGRVPMASGSGTGLTPRTTVGAVVGSEQVVLTPEQMPTHSHNLGRGTNATQDQTGVTFGYHLVVNITGQPTRLDFGDTSPNGSDEPHPNVQPSIVLNLMVQT